MNKFIIMGPNGAGKGTQAAMLCKLYDLVHISVGDVLRWNIQHHTKLAAQIHHLMVAGQLVPDEVVIGVVKARLEEHDWNYGFVLDGFPRSSVQTEFFLEAYDIDALIHLEVPNDVALKRMLSRRLCEKCSLDYNLIFDRPKVTDICDVCGGVLKPRMEDTADAAQEQLNEYNVKTIPILDLFRAKELVVVVNGNQPAHQVHAEILRELAKATAIRKLPARNQ
jgi:adenylate kinase